MPSDMTTVLAAQRAAFMAELPVSGAVRKDRINRVKALLVENAERIAGAVSQDFGHRSREQSLLSEVMSGVMLAKHALQHLDRWMRREKRNPGFALSLMGARAWVDYQPKGVVGVIAPWNFPMQLTFGPVVGAFAAGNRVMVKSSEITPATAALLEELGQRYFDVTELAFFSGGPEAGKAFAELAFDHILFTGATAIGRHILHAAADNLTPVTLELGGKSPTIIGAGADIDKAADKITLGKMMNAGQICVAPDYVLAPEDQERALVDSITRSAAAMYPTLLANPDYTSIVNERHHVRLSGYLDDARAKGATVIAVNPAGEAFAGANVNKMPLHILLNPTDDMAVMREEIFGPILPIVRYRGVDAAIAYVNARARPLALYYFGDDEAEREHVLERTIAGGVTLNDVLQHVGVEDLPFGGVGPSGMGSYHGFDGFKTFSHAKSVYKQARVDIAGLAGMRPPYGPKTLATLKREIPGLKS